MKKILIFIFCILFSSNSFAEECKKNGLKTSWYFTETKGAAFFTFTNSGNKNFLITKLWLYTSSSDVVTSRKVKIAIKPYGKISGGKYGINLNDLNVSVIKLGAASCEIITEKEAQKIKKETSIDWSKYTKKKKSWFKWWYILVGIFILGIIGYILDEMDKGKKNKTKSNERMRAITRKASSPLAEGENFIFDVFEGKKPLVQTFWFVFIILNFILSFISGLAAEGLDNDFFLIGAVVSNIWAGIGTWNSATNYQLEKIKKQEPYGWSYAAKILVVLNFISFAGQAILLING
jgi:hypothetical protein